MQQIIKDISEKALEIATQHELTIIAPCAHEEFDPEKHEESLKESVDRISSSVRRVFDTFTTYEPRFDKQETDFITVQMYFADNEHSVACIAIEVTVNDDAVAIFVCDEIDVKAYLDFVRAALEVMKNTRAQ